MNANAPFNYGIFVTLPGRRALRLGSGGELVINVIHALAYAKREDAEKDAKATQVANPGIHIEVRRF